MCGIAGFFSADGRPMGAAAMLDAMIAAVAHRGPDERGSFVAEGAGPCAGLAHARLSIIGIADGQQPMRHGESWISFNGEIFNYVELRQELVARGRRFRTSSDTEVILQLYDEMGLGCLDRLNGDFAFALWDGRARKMVLARDRMGVRPLFHTRRQGALWFGSEVKALLAVPGIEARLDPIALDQVLTLWAPIAPRTSFEGVEELPPGHVLVADAAGVTIRRWWTLDFPDAAEARAPFNAEAAAEELAALLADATRIRLRADVPVGSYLSGGLDSSIVSALAARQVPDRLETFSVAFDSAEHDESTFQETMANALGTRHSSLRITNAAIAGALPSVVAHSERPLIRTGPAPLQLLSAHVRQRGFKVVLTGEGADEVFAGYDIFKEAAVRRFCARMPGSTMRAHLFRKLYPYLPGIRRQSAEYLAAFFGTGLDALDDPLHSHRPRFRATAATKLFYSEAFRARIGGYDAAAELAAMLPGDFGRWHPLHQAQYLETTFLLPGYILSSQGDRAAMAHGIEGRFPFLDHRVVVFATTLPPSAKLSGLREKHILRKALRHLLPQEVAGRVKQPYRAPDSQAFAGTMPDYARRVTSEEAVAALGVFDPGKVRRLKEKVAAGTATGFRDSSAFIGVLTTQLWQERFATQGQRTAAEAA